ncbi:flagellar basal-body rod protein FlgF [Methylibium sp. Pch-M]|uniref:Flagellar basal-body rod protein FlgF n=1 Tax=Methylibium petroleiphilum (strain ATCC BAA-1232 / LMG 22953 / PM1) TaxID=420662 RepID=A2SKD3_METPP|nr:MULTISPECIES: flagellar basal-body rod protein FlgF [Methylibium]ABM96022.1 flagellar basal body and hook protein [Methylibium petroleiphilum PM1]EWS54757.1 putative proximal rod protein [Methylibium sp. T29]EWS61405.1 putative proximal rod protein [Methylibium sp. T29-B]MBN9204692.1 flagellar basal-body rod protein FlgF [Methylibium petroleiphilum]QAZ38832.1 flagellar basal-body rod protein FlgF [Methylibium sp. Pch-M]
MDRMIYLSMSGAKATMQRQETLANNLANASTTGFRAELQAFRAVPVRGDGASTRVYSLETTTGYDPTPGPMAATGRALDVAMQGNAWLAVQGLDGTEAYTRMGSLQVDAEGTLKTSGGLTVLGDGGPIALPANSSPQIAADGTVSVKQANGGVTSVGRLKLVTPEAALQRGDDGLFRAADGDLPVDPNARVAEGTLEGSNVNPIENMVAMIAAARQFESQMKMLQTAEGDEKAASQLLSMNG